jgi:transcriptional regulator with GAF, ATPase, and Fis domain
MRELMEFARKVAGPKSTSSSPARVAPARRSSPARSTISPTAPRKPFVPFNCTAVPRDLLESQLFGHRRGAFTGADRDHAGLIRAPADGTLFLDEVGELGLDLQPKLLRFLESGEISPPRRTGPMTVNVRIIAATNANLDDAVRDGRFREDLYYRLNVVPSASRRSANGATKSPASSTTSSNAPPQEFHKGRLAVAEETLERLLLYRWPGNVRQLQNEIQRMVALAEPNSTLPPEAISEAILGNHADLPARADQRQRDRRAAARQAHADPRPHRVRDDQSRVPRASR